MIQMAGPEKHSTNVTISENTEVLEVYKEEVNSPSTSMKICPSSSKTSNRSASQKSTMEHKCLCVPECKQKSPAPDTKILEKLLEEKETKLRTEYNHILEKEIVAVKEKFNYILQNEQMRASYMLREAHRERQEKITALESQLQCKNLAALMYVMCAEKNRSKLEKLRIIQEYTAYILALDEILTQAQELILHLSRGYKTAARVDHEWREKMKKVVSEFMSFIYNYSGGPPENNQFFIDLPKLLKTEAPIIDDPNEDPCQSEEAEEEQELFEQPKSWWEKLDQEDRPFVMFGDMSEFQPPQRREVLKCAKAARASKTAPKIWKEYVFNEMVLKRSCDNADFIKDVYPNYRHLSMLDNLDCQAAQNGHGFSKVSLASRRQTAASVDFRGGDMGSILKIITSCNAAKPSPSDKTAILGAKDSMEITSTTRLRHSNVASETQTAGTKSPKETTLDVGKRRTSRFEQLLEEETLEDETPCTKTEQPSTVPEPDESPSGLVIHTDSMQVIPAHVPEKDHKINYERVCPVEQCQKMQMDSFMRSLPPYMRANPFTHFEQTFEEYETCSPEQLEILKQRIEQKTKTAVEYEDNMSEDNRPTKEWEMGIGTQTSGLSIQLSCTCMGPAPSPVNSKMVFNLADLIPVKHAMDVIEQQCLYDDRIEFDRFKLLGQDSDHHVTEQRKTNFQQARCQEIAKILKNHPSLLDIFQANARC